MPRDGISLSGKDHHLVEEGIHKDVVIPAGKVRAADTPRKKGVSAKEEVILLYVVAHASRAVSGGVDHIEGDACNCEDVSACHIKGGEVVMEEVEALGKPSGSHPFHDILVFRVLIDFEAREGGAKLLHAPHVVKMAMGKEYCLRGNPLRL